MKVTKCFNPRLNQYGYYMTDANGDIKALTYEDGLKHGLVMLEQIRAEIWSEVLSHSGTGEEVIQAYVDGLNYSLNNIDKVIKEQNE